MERIRYIETDEEMKSLFRAYWDIYVALSDENYACCGEKGLFKHHLLPRCLTQNQTGGFIKAYLTREQHGEAHWALFNIAKELNIFTNEALSKLEFAARAFGRKPSEEELVIHSKADCDNRAIAKGKKFICDKRSPWEIKSVKTDVAERLISEGTHQYFHQGISILSLVDNKYIRVPTASARDMLSKGLAVGIAKNKTPFFIEENGVRKRYRHPRKKIDSLIKKGLQITIGTTNGFACAVNKKTGQKSMVPKGAIANDPHMVGCVYGTCVAVKPTGEILRIPREDYYRGDYNHLNKGYTYMYPDEQTKINKGSLVRYPVTDVPKQAVHATSGTMLCRSKGKRVPLNELSKEEISLNSPNYNKAYLYDIVNSEPETVPKSLKNTLIKSGKYQTTSAFFHLTTGESKRLPKNLFKEGKYPEWRSTSSGEYKRHKHNLEMLHKLHGESDTPRWLTLADKHKAVWAYSSVLCDKRVYLRDIHGKVIIEASSDGKIYSDFPVYASVNNQKRSFCSLAYQIEMKYVIEFGDSLMIFLLQTQKKEAVLTQGRIDGRKNSLANIIKREYYTNRLSTYISKKEMLTSQHFQALVQELYSGGEWRRYHKC